MTSHELRNELYNYVMAILGIKPSHVSNITKSLDNIYFELTNGHIIQLKIEDKSTIDESTDMDIYNTD